MPENTITEITEIGPEAAPAPASLVAPAPVASPAPGAEARGLVDDAARIVAHAAEGVQSAVAVAGAALHQVDAAKIAQVEKAAADLLIGELGKLPQVAAVAHLITGHTVADVQAAYQAAQKVYADVRAIILAEQSAAVPGAHAGAGAGPAPATAFDMIAAGIASGPK